MLFNRERKIKVIERRYGCSNISYYMHGTKKELKKEIEKIAINGYRMIGKDTVMVWA